MTFPKSALQHHIAALGKTGSGKTSIIKAAIIEPALAQNDRVCIIDPTGAWWGLRLMADGKRKGFPAYVFGGRHADYPLLGSHGEAMADVIGTTNTPAVLDTSLMKTGERMRFFTDFADAILRKNEGPLRLVIDEAHIFMPQAGTRGSGQMPDMLHAGNNMISLGRSRGLRIVLISQRAAKLHKDSLTQVETLIACRLIAPQDRQAVRDWIADQADLEKGKDIIASLPKLRDGEGWVWAPESDFLKRIQFDRPKTYDSSAAPTKSSASKKLSPVDLDLLKDRLAKVDQVARDNDPKLLRAEVAKLKAELSKKTAAAVAATVSAISDEDLAASEKRGFERAKREAVSEAKRLLAENVEAIEEEIAFAADAMRDAIHALRVKTADRLKVLIRERQAITPTYTPIKIPNYQAASKPMPRIPTAAPMPAPNRQAMVASDRPLGGERKPLSVLAGVYPAGMTRSQWAVASAIKSKGSTMTTYLSRLSSAGRVEKRGEQYFVTEQGLADLGGVVSQMPSPGPDLVRFWAGKISGASPLLEHLLNIYPRSIDRDGLGTAMGINPSGSTLTTYLSRVRSAGLLEESGGSIRLSPSVMA